MLRRLKKVQGKLGKRLGNVPKSFEIFLKGRFREGSDKV